MKKILISLIMYIFIINLASADLGTFKQYDCVQIRVLANCSSVDLTEVTTKSTTYLINSPMTNLGGQTFNYTFCNTSELGEYIFSWDNPCVDCSDGSCGNSFNITSTGSSNTMFFIIFIYSLALIFFISTLFVDEEFFVYISGILFLVAGIFIMINGLDNMNDWYTNAIAYVSLGLGFLFTIGAYLFNKYAHYSSNDIDYEE